MSSSRDGIVMRIVTMVLVALMAGPVAAQTGNKSPAEKFSGIGRDATPKEVAAWDIDVRADFKGLPPGSGSVAQGQDIWEAKCATCHGVFGESNQVFSPLIGGTTAEDVKTGRVASLRNTSFPGRTTLMKLATLSTLWDYINRAMPWTQPKSLAPNEVYAVTAFLLNLGGVVPDDFVLSDKNMAEAQARMPNRNGMTTAHGLWPGQEHGGKRVADVKGSTCMRNCDAELKVVSDIPPHARNAHGNLVEQNRLVGAQHGVDTAGTQLVPGKNEGGTAGAAPALALTQKYSCTACHAMNQKIVGPAFADIAGKYPSQVAYLTEKILKGGSGIWGPIPMPPQAIGNAEARALAEWLASGAPK